MHDDSRDGMSIKRFDPGARLDRIALAWPEKLPGRFLILRDHAPPRVDKYLAIVRFIYRLNARSVDDQSVKFVAEKWK